MRQIRCRAQADNALTSPVLRATLLCPFSAYPLFVPPSPPLAESTIPLQCPRPAGLHPTSCKVPAACSFLRAHQLVGLRRFVSLPFCILPDEKMNVLLLPIPFPRAATSRVCPHHLPYPVTVRAGSLCCCLWLL